VYSPSNPIATISFVLRMSSLQVLGC
jgi:hypothetical protein